MTSSEQLDHSPMTRGKYSAQRGNSRTADWVAEHDPSYLVWAYDTWLDKPCSHLLYSACVQDVADQARSMRVARDQDE